MTLLEQYDKQIPNYYDGMHRDGYTAAQILHALRREMVRSNYTPPKVEKSEAWNVKITSEVKTK